MPSTRRAGAIRDPGGRGTDRSADAFVDARPAVRRPAALSWEVLDRRPSRVRDEPGDEPQAPAVGFRFD